MKSLVFFFLSFNIVSFAQNVGIGTSNPSDVLHVNAPSNEDPLRVQIAGNTKLRVFRNGGVSIGRNNQSGTTTDGLFVEGNTGLGASSAQDRLVVNGNVDILGELKADGEVGEVGQFLTPDGNGNMQWIDLNECSFKNSQMFTQGTSLLWSIPDSAEILKIELWGNGGDGDEAGGGGAGGYACAFFDGTQGGTLTLTVGQGASSISIFGDPNTTATALQGGDASNIKSGIGGGFSVGDNGFGKMGESGTPTRIAYYQKSDTEFVEATTYGNGGTPVNGFGSKGSFITKNADTGTLMKVYNGSSGSYGAGGYGDDSSSPGRGGVIIIRW